MKVTRPPRKDGIVVSVLTRIAAVVLFLIAVLVLLSGIVELLLPGHPPRPSIKTRAKRVRQGMECVAKAIEAYHADHNSYPAWGIANSGPGSTKTYNWLIVEYGDMLDLAEGSETSPHRYPTFLMNSTDPAGQFATLTTPMNYLSQCSGYPREPFVAEKGSTFVYWAIEPDKQDMLEKLVGKETPIGTGWILISPGPDVEYNIPPEWDVYDPGIPQPSPRLLVGTNSKGKAYTYDPTNGTFSDGDIWRVRQ